MPSSHFPPRPRATHLAPTLAVVFALLAAVAPAAAAPPAWFSPEQAAYPEYTDHAAVAIDPRRGQAVCFGGTLTGLGRGGVTYQSDFGRVLTFGFDPTLRMVGRPATGAAPAARGYAACAVDSTSDRAWLFGGRSLRVDYSTLQPTYSPVPLADLWSLDLSASGAAWTAVTAAGTPPARRFGHSLVSDPVHRRLLLFGGRDSLGAAFGDLWQLDLASDPPTWSALVVAGQAPTPRWRHVAEFDPATQRMFMHGGTSGADTLRDTWTLDLSGPPRWDFVAVAPAPGTLTALAWDSRRSRLLGYEPVHAGVSMLDSTGGTPGWHALAAAAPVRGSWPAVSAEVRGGYDAMHDQFLLPYAQFIGQTFTASLAVPWTQALDPSVAPGAPANLAPQLLSFDAWHGDVYMRWSLPSSGGLLYELPGLEREVSANVFSSVGKPIAWDPDSAIALWRYPDQPLSWGRWQVRWYDPLAIHVATSLHGWTPAAPIAMSSSVDSAEVVGGAMRLRWTLANDSLSWLAAPHVYRRTGASTIDLGVAWPDSARRVAVTDGGITTGSTYTWWIGWSSHAGADTTGTVTRTVGAAIPYRVERQQPGVGTYLRWTVPGVAPFTATAYRRTTAGGAWAPFDTLDADASRSIVVTEHPLALGTHVEYRLGWMDAGVEAYTAAEVFDVPPFTADVESTYVGTRRVRVVWSVWPYDTLLTVKTVAVHGGGLVIERPATAGVPRVAVTDTTGTPGADIVFSVVARLLGVDHAAGTTGLAPATPPSLVAASRSAGHVTVSWSGSLAADAYGIWEAVDGSPFTFVSSPPIGVDLIGLYQVEPADVDSITYELRWHEWDGLWRATRDTTLHFTSPPPPVTTAQFDLATAQPARGMPSFRFALPDARPATVVFLDLSGRELWRTQLSGSGTFSSPGSLRAGVYWVRFTHPSHSYTRKVIVLQ